MAKSDTCKRCGQPQEHYNFEHDSTFWGGLRSTTTTVTIRVVKIMGFHYRSGRGKSSSGTSRVDEDVKLCADCWGIFATEFLHGKQIPSVGDQKIASAARSDKDSDS